MKQVRKLMLVPVEEWEKIKKQHPQISQVSSVEVEQSPQMKKVMKFGNNITMNKKIKQKMKQNMKQKLTEN